MIPALSSGCRKRHRPTGTAGGDRPLRPRAQNSQPHSDCLDQPQPVDRDTTHDQRLSPFASASAALYGLPLPPRSRTPLPAPMPTMSTPATARVTVPGLTTMKQDGRKIVAVTAYDYSFAMLLDRAGVDLLLVGDSLGMVIQGHQTTLPVSLEQMIYHTAAVVRGGDRALVICDLPFGICQGSTDTIMSASVRVLKESGCQGVKMEGGTHLAPTIRFLTSRHIPVMAHVGLTPQSVHAFGGFKVQGRGEQAAQVMADALAVAEAGAFALVLEGIPAPLAAAISRRLPIPTIGIGAGAGCDGQVLVLYDLLGLYSDKTPLFVKQYWQGGAAVQEAAQQFGADVRQGTFPGPEHEFSE